MASKVEKRGELRGGAVEKRPPGEAERDAQRAEDNVPLDARTGAPTEHGLMDRPEVREPGKDRQGLADSGDKEPHDHDS